jgi:uracil-DNA glycosylase
MNPALIPNLIARLRAFPATRRVANPYRSRARCHNLAAYLLRLCDAPYSGCLLIGEAPGYRGCALTGIPFTSQRVLAGSNHPFLAGLRSSLIIDGNVAEPTATMIWQHFHRHELTPAFWNVFPFHPHRDGAPRSNRTPTAREAASGLPFLEMVIEILAPQCVICVGVTAANCLARHSPSIEFQVVAHPSHGHKAQFEKGMNLIRAPRGH